MELLIPKSDKKLNGTFFTPDFIVDFIINELKPKATDKCLDPSCGTGAFLIGLVEYYLRQYGKPIRRTVQDNIFGSDILSYNIRRAKILFYTAITFLNKEKNDSILYDRIKKEDAPIQFIAKANSSPNNIKDLDVKKWRLLKTKEQKNIKIIETIGTPIKAIFDICVGIATLKDDVFFVDAQESRGGFYIKSTDEGEFKIEKEVTKAVYKISDFKSQDDITNNTRKIIFPYTIKPGNARPIPEPEFAIKYPECYKYLLSQKKILDSRDKGKAAFSPFYVWGRTQGLTKKGKKY